MDYGIVIDGHNVTKALGVNADSSYQKQYDTKPLWARLLVLFGGFGWLVSVVGFGVHYGIITIDRMVKCGTR
jgi:hypothetical protein